MINERIQVHLSFDPYNQMDQSFDTQLNCFNKIVPEDYAVKYELTSDLKHVLLSGKIMAIESSRLLTNGNWEKQLVFEIIDIENDIKRFQGITISALNDKPLSESIKQFVHQLSLFENFRLGNIYSSLDNYRSYEHENYRDDRIIHNPNNLPIIADLYSYGTSHLERPDCFTRINIWSNYICNQVDFIPEKHAALFEIAEPLENGAWWLQLTKEPLDAEIPEHRARLRAAYEALPKVGGRDLLIDQVK
jgi:hypothetical protein